jgi:repressor LexA
VSLLSDKQQQILEIIGSYLRDHRRPPTNREIGGAMGMSSTGHVDYHLGVLEKRGVIVRESNTARGVRLTSVGEDLLAAHDGDSAPLQITSYLPRTIRVPIHGRIAAGAPIEAVSDPADVIEVGTDLASEDCYALRVRGSSMIEDLIADGDIVIVRPTEVAANGDTVVALVTGSGASEKGDATLKRFYREGNMIRLQPANQAMQPIYVAASDLIVQGKVVALIRRV